MLPGKCTAKQEVLLSRHEDRSANQKPEEKWKWHMAVNGCHVYDTTIKLSYF